MQETQVRSLIWEDPTHLGATKPVHHNSRAREPQLLESMCPRAHALNEGGHQNEKPTHNT